MYRVVSTQYYCVFILIENSCLSGIGAKESRIGWQLRNCLFSKISLYDFFNFLYEQWRIQGFFGHTASYATRGCMLNGDGHLLN